MRTGLPKRTTTACFVSGMMGKLHQEDEQQHEDRNRRQDRAPADELGHCPASSAAAAATSGFRQREVRRHAIRLDDRLIHLRKHLLHRFVIHPASSHFRRELVLFVDLVERRRLTLRLLVNWSE